VAKRSPGAVNRRDRIVADAIVRVDIELTIGSVESARPSRRLGR
jgi:hypothetical protein